jgi:hypothetical protein
VILLEKRLYALQFNTRAPRRGSDSRPCNRRVDVSPSTRQQSTHRYPFNAKDYLALINTKRGEKKPPVRKKPKH